MADFLDKMVVMINRGAETISEGSKSIVEKAKINTAIHNAQERKKKAAELLGLQMYKLHMSGLAMPEELLSYCIEIETLCREIEGYNQQLIAMNNGEGGTEVSTENDVLEQSNVSAEEQQICKGCGAVNKDDSLFCFNCGNKLKDDE